MRIRNIYVCDHACVGVGVHYAVCTAAVYHACGCKCVDTHQLLKYDDICPVKYNMRVVLGHVSHMPLQEIGAPLLSKAKAHEADGALAQSSDVDKATAAA